MKMRNARRLIGTGVMVATLMMAPSVARAADAPCVTGSMTEPGCVVPPVVAGESSGPTPTAVAPVTGPSSAAAAQTAAPSAPVASGTTSLPFTGADIEGLAVIGLGGILAGGLLIRRRRRPTS